MWLASNTKNRSHNFILWGMAGLAERKCAFVSTNYSKPSLVFQFSPWTISPVRWLQPFCNAFQTPTINQTKEQFTMKELILNANSWIITIKLENDLVEGGLQRRLWTSLSLLYLMSPVNAWPHFPQATHTSTCQPITGTFYSVVERTEREVSEISGEENLREEADKRHHVWMWVTGLALVALWVLGERGAFG